MSLEPERRDPAQIVITVVIRDEREFDAPTAFRGSQRKRYFREILSL